MHISISWRRIALLDWTRNIMHKRPIQNSILLVALITLGGFLTGCSNASRNAPAPIVYRAPRSILMFDRNRPAYNPTEFGRNAWPATTNGYETVERSTSTELFQDNFGNAFNDRNTPRRFIRSFRQRTLVK